MTRTTTVEVWHDGRMIGMSTGTNGDDDEGFTTGLSVVIDGRPCSVKVRSTVKTTEDDAP